MRVAVGGGRDFHLGPIGWRMLDMLMLTLEDADRRVEVVKHGDAKGVDRCAGAWASSRGIEVEAWPAEWKRPDGSTDRAAGVRRTARMIESGVDVFVVFPGAQGTERTVELATQRGLVLVDLRTTLTVGRATRTEVRGLAEAGWTSEALAAWRSRSGILDIGAAQIGDFDGEDLPRRCLYVGGEHHGRPRSPLAMPCVDGTMMGAGEAVEHVRRRWSDRSFRSAMAELGETSPSMIVCSCGSPGCQAPALAVASISSRLTVASSSLAKMAGGRWSGAPSREETAASTVSWTSVAMRRGAHSA